MKHSNVIASNWPSSHRVRGCPTWSGCGLIFAIQIQKIHGSLVNNQLRCPCSGPAQSKIARPAVAPCGNCPFLLLANLQLRCWFPVCGANKLHTSPFYDMHNSNDICCKLTTKRLDLLWLGHCHLPASIQVPHCQPFLDFFASASQSAFADIVLFQVCRHSRHLICLQLLEEYAPNHTDFMGSKGHVKHSFGVFFAWHGLESCWCFGLFGSEADEDLGSHRPESTLLAPLLVQKLFFGPGSCWCFGLFGSEADDSLSSHR